MKNEKYVLLVNYTKFISPVLLFAFFILNFDLSYLRPPYGKQEANSNERDQTHRIFAPW